jgi:hypothetical protein
LKPAAKALKDSSIKFGVEESPNQVTFLRQGCQPHESDAHHHSLESRDQLDSKPENMNSIIATIKEVLILLSVIVNKFKLISLWNTLQ